MKPIALLILSVFAVGCTVPYMISTHEFEFTHQQLPDRDFYYTAYNITGSATSTYKLYGGVVRGGGAQSGMIADAKDDLKEKHPLQPNEAYINWCVDEVYTESGRQNLELGRIVQQIEYKVIVSADVIRFGQQPDYFMPQNAPRGMTAKPSTIPSEVQQQGIAAENQGAGGADFAVGDVVSFTFRGKQQSGVIQSLRTDFEGVVNCSVEFEYNGVKATRTYPSSELSRSEVDN